MTDNTPSNWATNVAATPNDLNVVSGSLSYPGLAPSVGNSVTNGGAGLGVRRLIGTAVTSGDLYVSTLFNLTSFGTGWSGAASSIYALVQTNNTTFSLSILVKTNTGAAGSYLFGLQKPSGTVIFDTNAHFAGETIFLVGRYSFDAINPDPISLWINADSSTFGQVAPLPTLTTTNGTDSIGMDRFNIRQNAATGANSVPEAMQHDELRLADTWSEVTPAAVPEPATLALFGLGLAGFVFRRWRR